MKARRRPKAPKWLRVLVLSVGLVAAAVLFTLAITARDREGTGETGTTQATGSQAAADQQAQSPPEGTAALQGIAALLIDSSKVGNGFATVQIGNQSLDDLIARLDATERDGERRRLQAAGFVSGAIASYYKPAPSPGPLQDSAVTLQILQFGDPSGARAQLQHDSDQGLVAGFGIQGDFSIDRSWRPKLDAWEPPSRQDIGEGVLLSREPTSADPSSPEAARVRIGAVVLGEFEVVVEIRSKGEIPIEELDRILALQLAKLAS